MCFDVSCQITIPRATYDGIRDGERSASHNLKAEQAKVKRLEILLQEMEAQSKIHSDRLKSVTAEKMRYGTVLYVRDSSVSFYRSKQGNIYGHGVTTYIPI